MPAQAPLAKAEDAETLVLVIPLPLNVGELEVARLGSQDVRFGSFRNNGDVRVEREQASVLRVKCHCAVPGHDTDLRHGRLGERGRGRVPISPTSQNSALPTGRPGDESFGLISTVPSESRTKRSRTLFPGFSTANPAFASRRRFSL